MTKIYGTRLKLARESADLTTRELADKLGVSAMCISKWETDKMRIPEARLEAIAAATDKDQSFFCTNLEDLDQLLTVGQRIRIFIKKDHLENGIIEIRGIVDDYYVCRQWFRHKKRWNYTLRDRYFFYLWNNEGWLSKAK